MRQRLAHSSALWVLVLSVGGCHLVAGYEEAHPSATSDAAVADAADASDGATSDGVNSDMHPEGPLPCPDGGCPAPLQIAAGGHTSCALMPDTTVRCWGRNEYGQLGRGDFVDSHRPGPVIKANGDPLMGVRRIALGSYHACALTVDQVYCWGANWEGQVGIEYRTPAVDQWKLTHAVAVDFAGGQPGTLLDIGMWEDETCALDDTGTVWCWGDSKGWTPTPRTDVQSATHLACGGFHCCAADDQNDFTCWGHNWSEQLNVPSAPSATIVQLAAGGEFSCALLQELDSTQKTLCWGDGWSGQFGWWPPDSQTASTPLPFTAHKLALGGEHGCALDTESRVRCWGYNLYGQLGHDSEQGRDFRTLTLAQPIRDIGGPELQATDLACGADHCCAIAKFGQIACWGRNVAGQAGHAPHRFAQPQPVYPQVSDVWAGAHHTCAMVYGALHCWGANAYGQLGDGAPKPLDSAVVFTAADGIVPTALGLGERHSCGAWDGQTFCWGADEDSQSGEPSGESWTPRQAITHPWNQGTTTALAAGIMHSCALDDSSQVFCWGDGWHGQLGLPLGPVSNIPVHVALQPTGVTEIASAGWTTCAHDGAAIYCWGANHEGQAGKPNAGNSVAPGLPIYNSSGTAITTVSALAMAPSHGCAIVNGDRNIGCWGSNWLGELGPQATHGTNIGFSLVETGGTDSTVMTDFVAVAAGLEFTCGARPNGVVWCWGDNLSHVPGAENLDEPVPQIVFQAADGEGEIVKLVAGDHHVCALTTFGALYCWGENSVGQLGDRHLPTPSTRRPLLFQP